MSYTFNENVDLLIVVKFRVEETSNGAVLVEIQLSRKNMSFARGLLSDSPPTFIDLSSLSYSRWPFFTIGFISRQTQKPDVNRRWRITHMTYFCSDHIKVYTLLCFAFGDRLVCGCGVSALDNRVWGNGGRAKQR